MRVQHLLNLLQMGVLIIKGHEPVIYRIEEVCRLHLFELCVIDIGPLLFLGDDFFKSILEISLETIRHVFVNHHIRLLLHTFRQFQRGMREDSLHEGCENLAPYLVGRFLKMHHPLYFTHLTAEGLVLAQVGQTIHIPKIRRTRKPHQHKSHQGALRHLELVVATHNIAKNLHLVTVIEVDTPQHNGRHKQLLGIGIEEIGVEKFHQLFGAQRSRLASHDIGKTYLAAEVQLHLHLEFLPGHLFLCEVDLQVQHRLVFHHFFKPGNERIYRVYLCGILQEADQRIVVMDKPLVSE